VSEHRTPGGRLLDLFVFGPTGLAVTAVEEFPKLVEKGRHRVEGQLHTARLVGQFAVQMGRRQVESALSGVKPGGGARPRPGPGTSPSPSAAAPAQAEEAPPGAGSAPPAPSENGALSSRALGIPGYDSLSASQVVQRLGGLSAAELEAIRDHELSHRHRRTILNRVEQLLADAGRP
jgi:hypothetical protein